MIGLILKSVEGLEIDSELLRFTTTCGRRFDMFHEQGCCEYVRLLDFDSYVDDFEGAEVTAIEEATQESDGSEGSMTWTFYTIKTTKGDLWLRWLGESNGYYGEEVDMYEWDFETESYSVDY